jgi:hypothetical protein
MRRQAWVFVAILVTLVACAREHRSPAELPAAGSINPPAGFDRLSVAETAAALTIAGRVELGVWSLLDHLGIGVYRPDGKVVLPGSESQQSDFWLYDFEVPILERMTLGRPVAFSEFAAYLRRHNVKFSEGRIRAAYAKAYAAHAGAFLPQLFDRLGLKLRGDPPITPIEQFLLALDGTVPPNRRGEAASADPPGRASAGPGKFHGSGKPSGWGLAYEQLAAAGERGLGSLALHGNLLSQSITADVTRSPGPIHEGHDGPGGIKQITVRVTADFALSTPVYGFPGAPGLTSFPTGPRSLSLDILWRFDPVAYEHGNVVPVAPGSEPGGATKVTGKPFHGEPGEETTDLEGTAAVQYRAREEPSHGKGTYHAASVNVSIELQNVGAALMAAGYPQELAATADIPGQTVLTGFELSWHSLEEHWSGTIHSASTDVWHGNGGFLTCTELWDMTLDFAVDEKGAVNGKGHGSLAGQRDCRASIPWNFSNAHHVGFVVRGTKADDHFDLHVIETSIDGQTQGLLNYTLLLYPRAPALEVPITGAGLAGGKITARNILDGHQATATHEVRLQCTDCGSHTP